MSLTVSVNAGNGQTAQLRGREPPGGQACFAPLSVNVSDAAGRPSVGTTVTFAAAGQPSGMVVHLQPSGRASASVVTDAEGVATLAGMDGASVVCYCAPGPLQIVASVPGGATATFNLTVAPTPPPPPGAVVGVVSGDGQSVARSGLDVPGGIATFAPLSVVVKDSNGIVIPDARVNWELGAAPPEMAVQLDPSGAPNAVTYTDDNGIATLDSMGGASVCAYYATGAFQVIASVAGGAAPATFNLTVAPSPPPPNFPGSTVAITAGNGQRVARSGDEVPDGIAKFAPLAVQARDQHGNPIAGAPMSWEPGSAPEKMAVQLDPSGAPGKVTLTDADGIATLDAFADGSSVYCYYGTGQFQVVASLPGGGSATFTLAVTG